MNLKDYQRGRNDGLALALKIVQEGGREALEAEIKNRGVTGGELIMNYNESKETVLQLLPAEEVILQFAEECVELSREILVFDVEADGRLLSNGTEYKMLSKVREEAADVETSLPAPEGLVMKSHAAAKSASLPVTSAVPL